MKNALHTQKGFSLLELLLAISVFFTLLLAIFLIIQDYAERELGRATNKYMQTVSAAMDQILSNPDNFNALWQLAVAQNGLQLIADPSSGYPYNITHDMNVNGTRIQASRLLNSRFKPMAPIRSEVRILLRPLSNAAHGLDIVIVTAKPRPDKQVMRAANNGNQSGGWIRTYGTKTSAVMQSAYGAWSLNPTAGLQGTPWYTSELLGSLNSNTQGSYLVFYHTRSLNESIGDYLYRLPEADVSRNTMYGAFNMGGNDIVGADDVNIGNVGPANPLVTDTSTPAQCAGNAFCVNGTAFVKGSGSISGNMITSGSALVSDSMSTNTMRVQNGLSAGQKTALGAQGLYVVDGTGNDGGSFQDEINVSNTAYFQQGTTSTTGNLDRASTQTLSMPQGSTLETNTLRATQSSSTEINGNTFYVDQQLRVGEIDNGSVQVYTSGGSRAGVIDITGVNNFAYGNSANPRNINVPRVSLDYDYVSNFGTCAQGCGQ